MTNSLSLKQCHFEGQSSILFPKYICEFSQGLYEPERIRFLYVPGIIRHEGRPRGEDHPEYL